MSTFRELDPHKRLYAIGDIHGCAKELGLLLSHLVNKEKLTSEDAVVFIGDYIDRGPDSRGVIQELLSFKNKFPNTSFLRGNHEDMFLSFLGFEGRQGKVYLFNGGQICLKSYGIPDTRAPEDVLGDIPPQHLSFLLELEKGVKAGKYLFVHAGLNPLVDLDSQDDRDLYWIRDEFIMNIHKFDSTVIFGHTPYQDIVFHLPYKIGIDTGVVFGNTLSCIELTESKIIQIKRDDTKIIERAFPETSKQPPSSSNAISAK